MKYIILTFLTATFISCSSNNKDEFRSLYDVYSQVIEENNREYQKLYSRVIERGGRSEDLVILNQIDTLRDLREKSGIVFQNNFSKIKVDQNGFDKYLTLFDTYAESLNVTKSTNHILERSSRFSERLNRRNSNTDFLYFLFNLALAENLILEKGNRLVGEECWDFGLNYVVHCEIDSLEINSKFNMIISPRLEFDYRFWDITIDSITIYLDDKIITDSYEFRKIQGSAYIEYLPKKIGSYSIEGIYQVKEIEDSYSKSEYFSKQFKVIKTIANNGEHEEPL